MLLTFIYPHDDIFDAVKQETSQFAVRQNDKDGNPLFESLVFDEAYLIKFRELFFNAQAMILPALATYQKELPADSEYFQRKDFSADRNFICHLDMPDDFNAHFGRVIEDSVFNFLKDWIIYKWLETKAPDSAMAYYNNCMGSDGYKGNLKSALNQRTRPMRRHHGLW